MKRLILVLGNISLAVGLFMAFRSSRIDADLMKRARLGLGQASVKEQREFEDNQCKRSCDDNLYNWGIKLTFLGIFLNTVGKGVRGEKLIKGLIM